MKNEDDDSDFELVLPAQCHDDFLITSVSTRSFTLKPKTLPLPPPLLMLPWMAVEQQEQQRRLNFYLRTGKLCRFIPVQTFKDVIR